MDLKPKSLIRRVFDLAVAEISRRSGPTDSPQGRDDLQSAVEARASTRERTQATAGDPVLRRDEHAAGVSAPVAVGPSSVAASPDVTVAEAPSPAMPREPELVAPADMHVAPSVVVVRGLQGGVKVRWQLDAARVARAEKLVDGPFVPCVRIVSFSACADAVEREVQDRPGVSLQGECDVGQAPDRLIASFGLRAGDRFVSVAHAVL